MVSNHAVVSRLGGRGDGRLVLAWTASRALAGDHHSLEEQLTAPDAPGLTPLEGCGQALDPDRAVLAQRLGELHVAGRLGEVQVRVVDPARQLRLVDPSPVDSADAHLSPPSGLVAGVLVDSGEPRKSPRKTRRPRIPCGFRGLECRCVSGLT